VFDSQPGPSLTVSLGTETDVKLSFTSLLQVGVLTKNLTFITILYNYIIEQLFSSNNSIVSQLSKNILLSNNFL